MVSKSVWGPCVWYLFHTLAYKAVPDNFPEIKADLIQYIQRIDSADTLILVVYMNNQDL